MVVEYTTVYIYKRFRENNTLLTMVFYVLVLLLLIFKICNSKFAVYILGDSISYRMYRFGLAPTFNCSVEDPYITRPVEKVEYSGIYGDYITNKAWKCSDVISRIGFLFHWGVSNVDGDYCDAYLSHRSPNDTTNSVSNIMSAVKEFQLRSGEDESDIFFIFSSNLWDVHRYQLKYRSTPPIDIWLKQYKKDYSSVVLGILERMRQNDKLILQTTHYIKSNDGMRGPSNLLNEEILKIAGFFNLPVFDPRAFIDDNDLHLEANDNRHQKQEISVLYAKQIGLKNWTNIMFSCSKRHSL